jgi:hypothetical protein
MRTGISSPAKAPRSPRQASWTVVLRCFRCQRTFAVSKATLDNFALPPQVIPCRHCGAQPSVSSDPHLHKIIEVRHDAGDD